MIVNVETQKKIVLHLSNGMVAHEIGVDLGLSKKTIEKYLDEMKKEHGVKTSNQLVAFFLRKKFIK